ncbi:sensor histidine kinase [Catonella massiliensis]|uniref:histidine kinase n=1 Tax=Catonella massiliensis TaxID=2799636 RepID=A0ABS1IZG7_9FIRM|nr:histidine kinase [Catonella massiliensis]MBK5897286.1 histidine kinase [Catonella massiliensis]
MKLRKRTLKKELMRTLLGTAIVIFFLVGGVLSFFMLKQSLKYRIDDLNFYLNSIKGQIDGYMGFLEDSVLSLRRSEEIERFLKEGTTDKDNISRVLDKSVNLFSSSNLVGDIYPFVKDLYIVSNNKKMVGTHFYYTSYLNEKDKQYRIKNILEEYISENRRFSYYTTGDDLELYFTIYDEELEKEGYGIAVLSKTAINYIVNILEEKYTSFAYMFKDETDKILMGRSIPLISSLDIKGNNGDVEYENHTYIYNMSKNSFGLSSCMVVPYRRLFIMAVEDFGTIIFIFISLIIGIILVILYISDKLVSPLSTIVLKMKQVGKGDFRTKLDTYEILELDEISVSFNEMTDKISHLIKEVYEAGLLIKEARIKYLQAQINPHFMFNVLSMIAIRLKLNKDEELYKMVQAFAGLMRGKLFRKDEIEIRINEEIEIAEFYLYLSKERFKNKVSYEINWEDEKLKTLFIPKLCIEPVVENAMIHGIEPKDDRGYINVKIEQQNNEVLLITVADNGVGFDKDKVISGEKEGSPKVGLMNINRLINNLYGSEYGIEVESKIGKGTKVIIKLPYLEESCHNFKNSEIF